MNVPLIDSFGRHLNYLRFAVIDRCNLRCKYCMPEEGIDWIRRDSIADTTECLRMLRIFHNCGIKKVRFTGGEPFMRADFVEILERVLAEKLFESVHLTTNGTLCGDVIQKLPEGSISGVNLSIDSLDPKNYFAITRRNSLAKVLNCLEILLRKGIPVKVNMVVLQGCNTHEIIPMAELAKFHPIEVRFIEEMPFNGTGEYTSTQWDHKKIQQELFNVFPSIKEIPQKFGDTAKRYKIDGFEGEIGVIASWTRNFCGLCNRIRLTATGQLRTCLYSNSGFSLLNAIRDSHSDSDIISLLHQAVKSKSRDGKIAEKEAGSLHSSMALIGG